MAIAFGIAIYQQTMQLIVTDQEYLAGNSHREIEQCAQPTRKTVKGSPNGQEVEKTPKEITACTQETKTRILTQRSYNTKESTIGGITRGIIFLVLFLTHYPRMVKEEAEKKPSTPAPKKRTPTRKAPAKKKPATKRIVKK